MGEVALVTAIAGDERKKKFFSVVNSEYKAGVLFDADCATFSATGAFLVINNGVARGDSVNGNVIVCPEYVKMTAVTGTGTGDGLRVIWKTDIIDRYTSGGTSLTTLAANTFVDTYSSFERVTACAVIHAGDLLAPAESSAAALAVCQFRPTYGAQPAFNGDCFITKFGGEVGVQDGAVTVSAMVAVHTVPQVYLGPGTSLVGHIVMDATSAATEWKIEIGWTELHHDFNA